MILCWSTLVGAVRQDLSLPTCRSLAVSRAGRQPYARKKTRGGCIVRCEGQSSDLPLSGKAHRGTPIKGAQQGKKQGCNAIAQALCPQLSDNMNAACPAMGSASDVAPPSTVGEAMGNIVPCPATVWASARQVKPSCTSKQQARRLKQLHDRTLYLQESWYAVALSQDVGSKPLESTVLGVSLVLYRDENDRAVALSNVCSHRGAPLHEKPLKMVDGKACVTCSYHNWSFSADGAVRDVPAKCKGCLPSKKLRTYEVVEKGGFVWLWTGSEDVPMTQRPPIPYDYRLDDPEWRPVYGECIFECGQHGVFENAMDFAHVPFVHTFGNQDSPEVCDMEVTKQDFEVVSTFAITNKRASPALALLNQPPEQRVQIEARAMLASTSAITFTLANGLAFVTFVSVVAMTKNRTRVRFALVRNWNLPALNRLLKMEVFDIVIRSAMLRVMGEDKAVVESLKPEELPFEFSVKEDDMQKAFSSLRQDCIDRGGGMEKLE